MENSIKQIIANHKAERRELLSILREVQALHRCISEEAISIIADEMDLPKIHVEGTASFYHFLSRTHRGKYTIYLNTSITSEMAGLAEVIQAFSDLGIRMGEVTADQQFGLFKTSCIGMSDQEPAALINEIVVTKLNPEKVKKLVIAMKSNAPCEALIENVGDGKNATLPSEILNHIQIPGPVFFSPYTEGAALQKGLNLSSLDIIEAVKNSGLRGRGGAGFPTGQKWAYARGTEAESRYVFCNIDEGEPGTFKDRVLITELAPMMIEGMVLAAYAIEANRGIIYLRGEYVYLERHLENILAQMRRKKLLGKRILGTRFSFDIKIKVGAGAYICGEESALIESAEGKRGQPRNRPPFPVIAGYRHRPTIVNNPETFAAVARIITFGADWFKSFGTSASSGTKLFSIAGDCKKPGIYELPWGLTIREILRLCEAEKTMAVQIGGPSGICISEREFDRKLCYEDLSTGGAITIFNATRNLFGIIHNYMDFFVAESCGFCVPCRAGNTLLLKALEKIMQGNGTVHDVAAIHDLGNIVKATSRCGLGQSSPNPLLTTIDNFSDFYKSKVRADTDYTSQFDLGFATKESARVAGRAPISEKK